MKRKEEINSAMYQWNVRKGMYNLYSKGQNIRIIGVHSAKDLDTYLIATKYHNEINDDIGRWITFLKFIYNSQYCLHGRRPREQMDGLINRWITYSFAILQAGIN